MSINQRTLTRAQWHRHQHQRRLWRRLRFQVVTFVVSLSLLIAASIYFTVRPIS